MLGFLLFLLANATLFIRPVEIFPSLEGLPIYYYVILACLVVSLPAILDRLTGSSLSEQPITICVLGIWVAVVLSHLSHFNLYDARFDGANFFKPVAYYVLLVSLIRSPARLRQFSICLVAFTVVLAGLALLQYHGVVNIPALEALERRDTDSDGEDIFFRQLQSTGLYNDPNDLCLILTVAIILSLYWMNDRRLGLFRVLWLAPVGLFGYALALTRSRGGFIALMAGILVLIHANFGRAKAILLSIVVLPIMFLLFAGRSTNISTDDETAQVRIQLWAEGVELFRRAPVFGIGKGMFSEEVGHVAHNSFVHSYTELGFFGGTLFLGAFGFGLVALYRLRSRRDQIPDPEMRRLLPYMIAIIAGYASGLLSLSRSYIEPTYMILGLVSAYTLCDGVAPALPALRFNGRNVLFLIVASVMSLIGIYAFIRIFARWG